MAAPFRLSILDLAPVSQGSSAEHAYAETVKLAQLGEALGYARVWYAEHHGLPSIASSSPDVLIANTRAIVPGAVMSVRPVGVLLMEDEAGGDEKIIAVPSSKLTQRYDKVKTYSDLPDITLQQIQHFFEHYKDLEPGKWVKVLRWGGAEEAHKLIADGIARAKK